MNRDRHLTPEEAAKYNDVRDAVKAELPEINARIGERLQQTLEQRVTSLEEQVAELRRLLASLPAGANWLENIVGSMKDYPEFEDVVRLGREIRKADAPDGDG